MLARHFRRRQRRSQAFRDDLPLLLDRPNTATLPARDDLDLRHTSTLTTNAMCALSGVRLWNQNRRCVHGRVPSQRSHPPQGVAAESLTVGKLLARLNFSHVSTRPRHPAQEAAAQEAHKKTSPPSSRPPFPSTPAASRSSSGGRTKPGSASKAA